LFSTTALGARLSGNVITKEYTMSEIFGFDQTDSIARNRTAHSALFCRHNLRKQPNYAKIPPKIL
jgi:hypothetical protein